MAAPYQFTPRIPVPPHPTPISVSAYKALPNSKAKRPPIHNPYDKFTQPEFDAWIGDITGALKRALGQIEAEDSLERTQEAIPGNATNGYHPIDLDESEDEALNDSFAEIKARRLLGKGKARDPREGPGLGGTDRTKPIEIVSSDEEEEQEVELAIGVESDDNEEDEEEEEEEEEDEDEEEEEDYSEQEEEYSWKQGQSSSQQLSPTKRRRYIQEEEYEEYDSEEGDEGDPIDDEELEYELEDDDEEAVIQPPTQYIFPADSRLARRSLPIPANAEFISIGDSDEETGLEIQEPITLGPPKIAQVEFSELQHADVEQNMEHEQSVEVDELVEEDTAYVHKPIPPVGSAPPSETDIAIWPLPGFSDQQDVMAYESLYENIEDAAVQPEEQAEVISTLIDWNYPPAFPAGIPTSAPGHLATPSSEESNPEFAVHTLDTQINSPKSVDEESSSHLLVHEEVVTQEKDLDHAPVENAELLTDQTTLSIPEPALVEDLEPQLLSQTFIVDPSSSHILPIGIAEHEHGEGVMSKEEHEIVEITSGDVTLADDNESAPAQQNLEDAVDEIESWGIDTSMEETKIMDVNGPPASVVLNSRVAVATTAEDDIPPLAEGIDEQMGNQSQPSASTSSVQVPVSVYHAHHTYDYDQLPTPPPDQSPTTQSLSVTNDDPSYTPSSPPRRHGVEIEEVQDEDDVGPQPFPMDSAELDLRIDIEPTGELYTVVEPEPNKEHADEDADAYGEIDFDIEIVSMSGASQIWDEFQSKDGEMQLPMNYVVEEPSTDGRLTEEPGDRALSLGVVSVDAEESEAHHTKLETDAIRDAIRDAPFSTVEEAIPLDKEVSSQVDTNIQPQPSSNSDPEEPTGSKESPTSATHVKPDSISSTVEHDVPMPIIANANFVDPTSRPDTPSHQRASLTPATLDTQPQAQQRASGDGLFTPADGSITGTPANIHRHVLDELARAFFGTPIASSTPEEEFSPVLNEDRLSDLGLAIDDRAIEEIIEAPVQLPPIGAEVTMPISSAHPSEKIQAIPSRDGPISPLPSDPPISMLVTPTRNPTDPILVSDPYPYSLSTPGVSLIDPTEEESEQDNSMSSNSTLERDLEDKDTNSNLDDADELELQYPLEREVLAELNGPAAAKGEEASKIVGEVAHADAHGDFEPESVVAPLPQSSPEVQQPAKNLPAIDSTVAPGPINGVEKHDVSPEEILPIEPARGIPSDDLPLTQTAIHDLPEGSTKPSNGTTGTPVSTQASKRKRKYSPPPLKKVKVTTADKVEKGKNEKGSKLDGKREAKDTNQGVVDQTTSRTTIHVKPRRKTQPFESVAKRTSEAKTASRSSSGASAARKILSRSSSVASSFPSEQSVSVPPSPTVHKPNATPIQHPPKPVSLLHAHGQKHNNQNKQFQSSSARSHPVKPPMPSIQRVISLPRINVGSTPATSPTAASSPTVDTSPTRTAPPVYMKAVPPPPVRHSPAISSSPITRSHCRYHRISLPREDGGPRVCFLVPGCSLSDGELITAEEIEDHGDATQEDSLRMIKDLESFDFDSYLIGILRKLVGLDILREQEVFYLPQPGDEVVRKTSRKERSGVFRGADSSSYAGSPGYSGSIRSPTSMKAPTSLADSTSTSLSAFRKLLDSEKDSASNFNSDSGTEFDDGEPPETKRARPSSPEEQGGGAMGPPPKAQGKRQLKGRRSKQIEGVHEGDSDDAQSRNSRKTRSSTKRRRDSEISAKDDGEGPESKRLKLRIRVPVS